MAKWTKGESGNPGGRPSGLGEIREIARQHTDAAIDTLVKVMENTEASPSARVAAASALLDRGWGRPEQSVKASVNDNLGDALQAILERREARQATSTPELAS